MSAQVGETRKSVRYLDWICAPLAFAPSVHARPQGHSWATHRRRAPPCKARARGKHERGRRVRGGFRLTGVISNFRSRRVRQDGLVRKSAAMGRGGRDEGSDGGVHHLGLDSGSCDRGAHQRSDAPWIPPGHPLRGSAATPPFLFRFRGAAWKKGREKCPRLQSKSYS